MDEINNLSEALSCVDIDDEDMSSDIMSECESNSSINDDNIRIFMISIMQIVDEGDHILTVEIVDHIVVFNKVLYYIDTINNEYKIIMYLTDTNNQNIPQLQLNLNESFMNFVWNTTPLLVNNSNNNYSFSLNGNEVNTLKEYIVDVLIRIMNEDDDELRELKEWKAIFDTNIIVLFRISIYLEEYFDVVLNTSFYSESIRHYNNDLFAEIIRRVKSRTNIKEANSTAINKLLLTFINLAQNIMVIIGPYGIDSLEAISNEFDTSIIFNLTTEAKRYFALHNIIALIMNGKRIHLRNIDNYLDMIYKGAKIYIDPDN